MNTKIIYWPKGGSVEKVAKKLEAQLKDQNVNASCVTEVDYSSLRDIDLLIMGGSTVGADDWKNTTYKDAWTEFFAKSKAHDISLKGKKVALFGLGNQVLYPEHFVDSIKAIAEQLEGTGAELVGHCKNEGYDFEASEALVDGKFIGLPIDEDTQAELTDSRLAAWTKELGL